MLAKVTIDGTEYEVREGRTILETCKNLGIFVPYLCYMSDEIPTGNCGLCVVEIDGKMLALSCRVKVKEGISIVTKNARIDEMRKANLIKILEKHEINCLNCNKNGVCRLQDISSKILWNTNSIDLNQKLGRGSIQRLSDELVYDQRKCIQCNRCVKFLNTNCESNITSITQIEETKGNLKLNVIEVCPTSALSSISSMKVPEFMCDQIWTYDITDVFMPKFAVSTYANEVIKVQGTDDELLKDETRITSQRMQKRNYDLDAYCKHISKITEHLKSTSKEKNIFIIGDYCDIHTFQYIKHLTTINDNIIIATNALDNPYMIGFDREDLAFMESAVFCGNFEQSEIYRITSKAQRLKKWQHISPKDICKGTTETLILSYDLNSNSMDEAVLKTYSNIHILPKFPTQMLLNCCDNISSVEDVFKIYNRNDVQMICVIGNIEVGIQDFDCYSVSHSVKPIENMDHIPSKHYIEDSSYYLNVFGEHIKTISAIQCDLTSNLDFVRDIIKSYYQEDFENIEKEINAEIQLKFFK